MMMMMMMGTWKHSNACGVRGMKPKDDGNE